MTYLSFIIVLVSINLAQRSTSFLISLRTYFFGWNVNTIHTASFHDYAHFIYSFISAFSVVPDTLIDLPLNLNTLQSMVAQNEHEHLSHPPFSFSTHSSVTHIAVLTASL
jgi:hypothetical protein